MTKKYALEMSKAYEKGEWGLLGFALYTLCETENDGTNQVRAVSSWLGTDDGGGGR